MYDRRILGKIESQIIYKAKKPGGNSDVEGILGLSDDVYTTHGLKDISKFFCDAPKEPVFYISY
jgi:hypothetical protein